MRIYEIVVQINGETFHTEMMECTLHGTLETIFPSAFHRPSSTVSHFAAIASKNSTGGLGSPHQGHRKGDLHGNK